VTKDNQTYHTDKPFKQKVNIELLRWGTTSGKIAPLRDFLMIRLLMTKQRTCVLPKKKVLKFLSWTRLYRVQEFGFIKLEKGNVWLVGAKKIEEKLNLPKGKYVFLSLDNLRNLVRTTIEVFAVHVQRARKYAEKWHGQKTHYERGASGRLLARILNLDIHTIYRHKDKSNWKHGKCVTVDREGSTKLLGHFRRHKDNKIMFRLEDRCTTCFDFFFDAVEKTGKLIPFNFEAFLGKAFKNVHQ